MRIVDMAGREALVAQRRLKSEVLVGMHQSSFFPVFCIAVFFILRNLYACTLVLTPEMHSATGARGVLHLTFLFFFAIALFLGAYTIGRGALCTDSRGAALAPLRAQRIFSILLAGILAILGIGSLILHLEPGMPRFPLPAVAYGLFWLVATALFFAAVPDRHGYRFGCGVAAGELIWLILLPAINVIESEAQVHTQLVHLGRLIGVAYVVLGLSLAWAVTAKPGLLFPVAQKTHAGGGAGNLVKGAGRRLQWGLFAAALLLFFLFGMGTGLVPFPKLNHAATVPNVGHYLLLLCSPLAGELVDRAAAGHMRGGRILAAAIMAFACSIPVLLFAKQFFSWSAPSEIALPFFLVGREMFFVPLVALTGYLVASVWSRAHLPLFFGVIHCLYFIVSFLGVWFVQNPIVKNSEVGTILSLCLLAGFGLLLFRICRGAEGFFAKASEKKEVFVLPAVEPPYANQPSASAKFVAFCTDFSLTRREKELLGGLVDGVPMSEACGAMGITERTFRFHLKGILKKTGMINRRRLLIFYGGWSREE